MKSLRTFTSVGALIQENCAAVPEQSAFEFVGNTDDPSTREGVSYAQMDARARGVAAWLLEHAPRGSRILLLYPLGIDFITAFVGCVYADMIAVPAPLFGSYEHERRRALRIVNDAGVAAVLTHAPALPDVQAWSDECGLREVRCIATNTDGVQGASDGLQIPTSEAHGSTVLLLQYTSGSTGAPKGVVITHDNILANVSSLAAGLGLDHTTKIGGWIPQYHDMGLLAQIMPTLMLRTSGVLMRPRTFLRRPHQWLQMIDTCDIAYSAAPNFAYDLCTRVVTDQQIDALDLSRWAIAANGSEPVQASTIRNFTERFARAGLRRDALSPCYGMAEATVYISGVGRRAMVTMDVDPESFKKRIVRPQNEGTTLCSSGRTQDIEARVVDPDTLVECERGTVGEIWLRGDSIAAGYWDNEQATTERFRARTKSSQGPFLRTGDLGYIWDGEVFVTGRIKETIIIHGRNVYPQDIEHEARRICHQLEGRFGAAFCVHTRAGAEVAVLLHEIKGRYEQSVLAEIARTIKSALTRQMGVPLAAVVLLRPGQIDRTTSGKIQRLAMRERFLSGDLQVRYEERDDRIARCGGPA